MARGNYRQNIVQDDADRGYFIELMRFSIEKYECKVHSFVLMDNHYHWLLETGNIPIWNLMKYFGLNYSAFYNRKYGKIGHLFQGRYKACLVKEDSYFLHVGRYIHLNPVKAGLAACPEQYRWSSYRTYMGIDRIPFIETEKTFSYFGKNKIANYRKFTENKTMDRPLEQIRREMEEDELWLPW